MDKQSKFKEEILSEENIFEGHVVNLFVQEVKLPNGETSSREIIKHNGAVGIILVKNKKIALVRQWRSPMQKETLEIPAGKIDLGESDIKKVAERELREETGYIADDLIKVSEFFGSPGYSNELLYLFLAKNPSLEFNDLKLDDDEFLNVEWKTMSEVKKEIDNKVICDAKTLLAINYWQMNKDTNNG